MEDREIKKALECCAGEDGERFCCDCPCKNVETVKEYCDYKMLKSALDLINRLQAENERLKELVDRMGDYFPACIGCEGKTEFGERTDECVYMLDNANYCVKRGISNIVSIQKENRSLKEQLETANAENESLKNKLDVVKQKVIETIPLVEDDIKTAKAEAIKEFITELEKRCIVGGIYPTFIKRQVENVKKKLVGDNNV